MLFDWCYLKTIVIYHFDDWFQKKFFEIFIVFEKLLRIMILLIWKSIIWWNNVEFISLINLNMKSLSANTKNFVNILISTFDDIIIDSITLMFFWRNLSLFYRNIYIHVTVFNESFFTVNIYREFFKFEKIIFDQKIVFEFVL